jgi:chromosome segregation ATPase
MSEVVAASLISGAGTSLVAVLGGWFGTRNLREQLRLQREQLAQQRSATEATAQTQFTGQLITAVQGIPELLRQYGEVQSINAKLEIRIGNLEREIDDIKGDLREKQAIWETERAGLAERCCRAEAEAARVPFLLGQVATLTAQLAEANDRLERARIEAENAGRAQERAEGGLAAASHIVQTLAESATGVSPL